MNSPFSTPSCPCCAFLTGGGGLFLPWNEQDEGGETNNDVMENNRGDVSFISAEDITTPHEAWDRILDTDTDDANERHQILLVDTHGHPHLEREVQYANDKDSDDTPAANDASVVSLTCAVSPLDWNSCLEYASQSLNILPALGVHPWYLSDIMVDDIDSIDVNEDHIEKYIKLEWLQDLEDHTSEHPHLLVGEIGLCKMARFVRTFPKDRGGKATALQLQKIVFRKQLELAAKWSRPVTVHCVNAHGLFMEVMKDILKVAKESSPDSDDVTKAKQYWRRSFPPAIGMHSFTGTAHHVSEILGFEKELLHPEYVEAGDKRRRQKQQQQVIEESATTDAPQPIGQGDEQQNDMLFYFGFSHSVNHVMCTSEKARKKGMEAVRAIPLNRLLVESDVHNSVDVVLGTAGAVAYAAQVRGERLEDVAKYTTKNGLRFLSSIT